MADVDAADAQLIVKLFNDFAKKDAEGKVFCRCCENFFKDNKGHSNLASHARNRHKEQVQEKVTEALAGATRGPMGNWVTVTKVVSAEAKNMFAWIEWIVMADTCLYV